MMDINECIEKGYLKKSNPDSKLSEKELKEALYDLDSAKKTFEDGNYKWCIVKCYYSMFHTAKSLLFKLGYIEKRHIAVIVILEDLNKKGRLESKYLNDYKAAFSAREDADYNYTYSKETADYDLDIAEGFLNRIEKLLNKV